ncbi:hypothetical protein SISSUDRAFT_388298 [Sistotremastrum suecicum HHB10207 ss-3]|uniref:Uncharacterized protein n=1 Tax=Sistotremastrum suecicum HHB10207 ss-3 TaxID=1314776 RepID=A0A166FWG8_9AGAM|nr:hypothetical protein SISSUDRAFT_388298 [Sistotremastrum suecicum HHB10207 ss-3]
MAGVSGPSQFFGDEESTTKVRHSHIYCMISIGACQLEVAYVAILMISHLRRRLLQSGIVAYSSIRSTIEIATSCTLTPNMDDRTAPRAIVKKEDRLTLFGLPGYALDRCLGAVVGSVAEKRARTVSLVRVVLAVPAKASLGHKIFSYSVLERSMRRRTSNPKGIILGTPERRPVIHEGSICCQTVGFLDFLDDRLVSSLVIATCCVSCHD